MGVYGKSIHSANLMCASKVLQDRKILHTAGFGSLPDMTDLSYANHCQWGAEQQIVPLLLRNASIAFTQNGSSGISRELYSLNGI